MSRPPVLPTVDWENVFAAARDFEAWTAAGEHRENVEKMQAAVERQQLDALTTGALRAITRPVRVVVFAETWCPGVTRHVPVLERMARENASIEVRYLERHERPDVFARFLTNGGEALPKFVFLSDRWVECANWGPMTVAGRELIARGKACGDVPAAREKLASLYAADRERQQVVGELLVQFTIVTADRP